MPRTFCKTQSLILCFAFAAFSASAAVAGEPDNTSSVLTGGIVPLQVKLDLGNGPIDDAPKNAAATGGFTVGIDASAVTATAPAISDPNKPFSEHASGVIEHALSLVGVTYRRGGNTPASGLDCSGLVRLVFHDVTGLELPRRAVEISHVGQNVNRKDLQPGDLLFFNTVRRTISHVGIYLGDGQFIHAPASGGRVRIENINMPYWIKHFSVARRVPEGTEASDQ